MPSERRRGKKGKRRPLFAAIEVKKGKSERGGLSP